MFERTSVLTLPSNSLQPLWRYLSCERLLSLLESESLFFAHLPKLSDGLEGTLTARSRDRLLNWFLNQGHSATTALAEVELYEEHRDAFFVNCWHMNSTESYLMWRVYADRGFAIQTTFERAQISFDRFDGKVTGGVVEYIDYEREEIPVGNVFTAVVKKDIPYRDEREFRLLVWQPDRFGRPIADDVTGIPVTVDLERLIERIYVSPRVSQIPPSIREVLERKKLSCPVLSSVVKDRT